MHMSVRRTFRVLVAPLWRSSSFWPMLCLQDGSFMHWVKDTLDLPTVKSSYTPCKSGQGIFGNADLKFRMLALKLDFRV